MQLRVLQALGHGCNAGWPELGSLLPRGESRENAMGFQRRGEKDGLHKLVILLSTINTYGSRLLDRWNTGLLNVQRRRGADLTNDFIARHPTVCRGKAMVLAAAAGFPRYQTLIQSRSRLPL